MSYIQGWPKGLFGFLCYVARENPNELLANAILPKDDGKARRRKKMGMVTSEAEEVRLLILRDFDSHQAVPTPSSGVIAQVVG